LLQANRQAYCLTCAEQHRALLEFIFEAFHYLNLYPSRGRGQFGMSCSVEIMGFERSLLAIEIIVGSHPGVIRRIRPAILAGNKNARGNAASRCVEHIDNKAPHRLQVVLLLCDDLALPATWYVLYP